MREKSAGADDGAPLQLVCAAPSEVPIEPKSTAVFSSIQQTVVALVSAASEQANQRAAKAPATLGVQRDASADRLELAVQRANSDQARRVSECTRLAFEALVMHCIQPCFAIDEAGTIVRWNVAMSDWTGTPEFAAIDRHISTVFAGESAVEIEAAGEALREAEEAPGGVGIDSVFVLNGRLALHNGRLASRIALLPLCRVPRFVEAIFVLVTPSLPSR